MKARRATLPAALLLVAGAPGVAAAADADPPAAVLPVVCIAEQAARLQAPVPAGAGALQAAGGRHVRRVGAGFVVDRERQHVLTTWHTATACPGGADVQIGIAERVGGEWFVTAAARLPDRSYQDGAGRPVRLVQAVCRDPQAACGADLPPLPGQAAADDDTRRRERANVHAYAPDLAVLRLLAPARSAPLGLAVTDVLDDGAALAVRGPVDGADVAGQDIEARYAGPHQISWLPQGGAPGDEVHARLHRLQARVPTGLSGSPVLRGSGVVGLLSALDEGQVDGKAYAVPATVAAAFLDLLKVPYLGAVAEPLRPDIGSLPPPTLPADRAWHADPQRLMLLGAGLLALLAAGAFALLAWRNARELRQAAHQAAHHATRLPDPPLPQRTVSRVNPTLLHAVALPARAADEAVTAAGALPAHGQAHAHLLASHGPLGGSRFSLPMPNGGLTLFVGRDPQSCQVVLPAAAAEVSAVHACFVWEPGRRHLGLRDLSSSGTWLNGERVAKGQTLSLAHGDRVTLGDPEGNRLTVDLHGTEALR